MCHQQCSMALCGTLWLWATCSYVTTIWLNGDSNTAASKYLSMANDQYILLWVLHRCNTSILHTTNIGPTILSLSRHSCGALERTCSYGKQFDADHHHTAKAIQCWWYHDMHLCQLQMAVQSLGVARQADCTEVHRVGQKHDPNQHPKSTAI